MSAAESERLLALLPKLAGARAAVIGDLMLDRFVYGAVERISPEAPIPVLRIEREAAMLGGAGNVARNLAALGARVSFAAVIGRDAAGHELERLLAEEPRIEAHLAHDPQRPTTVKMRFIGGSQQLLRADKETSAPLAEPTRRRLADELADTFAACGVVVLSDYDKGVLSAGAAAAAIAAAAPFGKPIVVDPKGTDYRRYRGATALTPNARELADATGMPTASDAEVVAAANALIDRCGVEAVLATRGPQGMTLARRGRPPLHLPARAVEVFDVSGAGDTVLATFAAALGAGAAMEDAAALANAAAGVVVAKLGTAVCTLDELADAVRGGRSAPHARKIVDRAELAQRVADWRRSRLRVGFTNGCFDILHPGHVSLMRQARAACDRLVVGLNTDASVKRLKGPSRPVNGERARAAVLASLADVDAVTTFDEDTPLALIELVRPEVLVKGADYTVETVVGADRVQSWDGKVVLADLSPGFSTTATIAKMAGS